PDNAQEQYAENEITKLTVPDLKPVGSVRALEITQDFSLSRDGRYLLLRCGAPDEEQVRVIETRTMQPVAAQ
ncbi:MAG TPA: hypothetical protein VK474_08270, partial [Chthoniobacterales bacterium]|nr:hypothetical protein [Chthoniobacterales bacterium]